MRLPSLAPLTPSGLIDATTPFIPTRRYALVLGGALAAAPFAHALLQWMAVLGARTILVCVGAADGTAEVAAAESAAAAVEAAHPGSCAISVRAVGPFAGDAFGSSDAAALTVGLLEHAAEQGVPLLALLLSAAIVTARPAYACALHGNGQRIQGLGGVIVAIRGLEAQAWAAQSAATARCACATLATPATTVNRTQSPSPPGMVSHAAWYPTRPDIPRGLISHAA